MFEFLTCRAHTSEQAADGRFAYPGSSPHYAPDRPFDTQHVRLELSLDFARKTLKGKCITTLKAIAEGATEMAFDAVDFKDLKVWRKAHQMTFNTRRATAGFPREEMYGFTSQLRRAVL